ncbi:MAG TPA: Hpt domain-containing protein, partial [Thermoanaerobaculia bacterium]
MSGAESAALGPGRPEVPIGDFLAEAWKLLAELEAQAKRPPGDAEAGSALAVLLHRLKGSAALYELPAVSRLAAALEARLGAADGGRAALAAGLEWLRGAFAGVEGGGTAGEPPLAELFARLPELAAQDAGGGDATRRQLLAFAAEDREVLADFLPEVEEYVEGVAAALAPAGDGDAARDPAEVARRVHTLKGTAQMVGCLPVGTLAHAMEDVLQELGAAGGGAIAGGRREALAEAAALLRRMLDVLAGGGEVALDADLDRVLARLAEHDGARPPRPEAETAAPPPPPA